MIKLYGVSISPFVRKVIATLKTKNLPYEMVITIPGKMSEDYHTIHPLKKIPALVDGSVTLADSSVICDYLENKYSNTASIYPSNPEERAAALWLEEYADSRLMPAIAPIFVERILKPKMRQQPTDEQKVQEAINNLPAELSYLENQINGPFLVGDALSIADIAVVTNFINAQYANYEVDAAKFPKLSKYLKDIIEHPVIAYCLEEDKKLLA